MGAAEEDGVGFASEGGLRTPGRSTNNVLGGGVGGPLKTPTSDNTLHHRRPPANSFNAQDEEDDDDDEDDFEPRRPVLRPAAALFDPSPAPAPSLHGGRIGDEEREKVERALEKVQLGFADGAAEEGGGEGGGFTYSSVVRR